jgi:RNA-directed DNA polymerase
MKRWNERWHVKYKKHSLINQVCEYRNLEEAFKAVKANQGAPGIDGVTIEQFEQQLEQNLREMQRQLKERRYIPQPVKRVYIPKANGGQRPLGIPTVRDRVVQQALKNILEPIFEPIFLNGSYGYRPGKSAMQAVARAAGIVKRGYWWVVDADIKGFFDNVDHEILLDLVNEQVSDGTVLKLIRLFLESGVLKGDTLEETPTGTPQGGVISPLLANIMLNHLDRRLGEEGYILTRYADDFLIHCMTENGARKALARTTEILEKELHLKLSPEKTSIRPIRQGVDFLGYNISMTNRVVLKPNQKSNEHFKDAIRGKTVRAYTVPLVRTIQNLVPTMRGWGNYFQLTTYIHPINLMDSWVRRRLRSCALRRRMVTAENYKYSNAYFENLGHVTLVSRWNNKRGVPPPKQVGGSKRRGGPSFVGKTDIRPRAVYGNTVRTVL